MITNQEIADLAYRLWVERGRPDGSADADWSEAERQLAPSVDARATESTKEAEIDASLEETFPASDPPASHLPDLPPANASDKWAAASSKSRNAVATAPGDSGEG
jgi:hypothetical protein